MKQELMTEVMQQMLPYLDNAQLKQLRQVMEQTLFHYEVTGAEVKPEKDDSNDLVAMFIAAKRIEGCSEKTLKYYQTTIDAMVSSLPEYDVFLSHANQDKAEIVDELYESLEKLGISIFYDKETLEWGDNWKKRILEGTQKAEFAIIIISDNFFGREWTEKELSEFLGRQNRNGQKLILPIVHNITNEDLREKYPSVADIQTIDSQRYTCDQIALLFAKQLIKRLKAF